MNAPPCSFCGLRVGDRVRMKSGLTRADGTSIGFVHGVVEPWNAGCGHIVMWSETGCATGLGPDYPRPSTLEIDR